MKKKLVILILGMVFLLAGCQNQVAEVPEESVTLSSQEKSVSTEAVSTEEVSSQEKTYSLEELPDGSATCTYAEITVTIPAEWKDKYIVQTSENGIYFYQKASWEVEEGSGYLCAIIKEDNMIDWPETRMIAYTDEHIYYFTRPSDVPCVEVSEISSAYAAMTEYTKQMEESVVLDVEGLRYDMEE